MQRVGFGWLRLVDTEVSALQSLAGAASAVQPVFTADLPGPAWPMKAANPGWPKWKFSARYHPP